MQRIERQAAKLSRGDQQRLAQNLMAGLDGKPLTDVDEAWIRQAERRYRRWKTGHSAGIPAKRVLSDIRKTLPR